MCQIVIIILLQKNVECFRYDGVDSVSNMAVIAVAMVSGWIPDKSSIQKVCLIFLNNLIMIRSNELL